ncbi:sulfite exporter TauE/SafE family protein [Neolewinella antarctica]|uniref:Urease accessory protein UreH-like transmembrane domain-containing protein n=1 Tax=Neolewinella antarctica TaxID=442734 RepID=A0ABX0X980_9BACT|nr:sulfite exporter TauE/SafE family protein [Neolewinella antarctica]NJC25580.1 hypothetical protein [Neolewinella antarctica]
MGSPEIIAAFSLGLLGSLHCVGMCGPLMLAAGAGRAWKSAVAYQTGRISVYASMGFLLGSLGLGMAMWNAQSVLSLVAGSLLIACAVVGLDPGNVLARQPAFTRFQVRLRSKVQSLFARTGWRARFALGCCNGLLPCGLVYVAILGAAGAGGPVAGAGFMLSFGLGTLPLLILTLVAGRRFAVLSKIPYRRVLPVLMALTGLILLYRGYVAHVPDEFSNFQDMAFPPMCH